jgi:predicted nuclease of predicted toxin-antitoxin system
VSYLIDAQLPRRLARSLREIGHDTLHTLDLPLGNRTPDSTINAIARQEGRTVITKDTDFVNSFLLFGKPERLVLVSTGNITNTDLVALFLANVETIEAALQTNGYVELTRSALIIRG